MKYYNVEVSNKLKLESLVYRVSAVDREDCIKKVNRLGFNCGWRLSSTHSGEFKAEVFSEITQTQHKEHIKMEIQRLQQQINEFKEML